MQQKIFPMTRQGLETLVKEKTELERNRPAAVLDLKKAREMGDLSENGYYKAARAKLSSIDARLRHLSHTIRFARVQEASSTEIVGIGVTVTLDEGVSYMIVGEHEANPSDRKISHLSPLGKALMYKKNGDTVIITTPNGQKSHRITAITLASGK